MRKVFWFLVFVIINGDHVFSSGSTNLRSVAQVERNPILLHSFLPAAMQLIAHCTELLKYDVRPAESIPTSTTLRPTPPHSPGIYAPKSPPPPSLLRKMTLEEYFQRLKVSHGVSYFDKYKIPLETSIPLLKNENLDGDLGKNLWSYFKSNDIAKNLELLGQKPINILKQILREEDYDFIDDDLNVQKFGDDYSDASFRNYVIGNKVVPPTKAYVTLLTLYDLLNKESKKLQFNKYGGYADDVLQVLVETSVKTSANQLQIVLDKVLERQDTTDQNIINKIKALLEDLNQQDSYLNLALKYIPPLSFSF